METQLVESTGLWVGRLPGFGLEAFGMALIVLGAVLVDLFDGLHTARVLAQPVESHKLRKTVMKIIEYWRLLLLGLMADAVGLLLPAYGLPYVGMALTVGVVLIEALSLLEHARHRRSSVARLPDAARRAADVVNSIRETLNR